MGEWVCDTCNRTIQHGQTHICQDPYRGWRYKSPPPPPYDTLHVGGGGRHAFKNGVEVDEHTGVPLNPSQIVKPPKVKAPTKRRTRKAKMRVKRAARAQVQEGEETE